MGVGRRAGLDRIVLTVVNKLCLPRLVLPYYLVWFSTNSDTCRQDLLSAHDGSIVVILEGKSVYFTPERIVFCCCCNYVIYFCFCYRGKMSSLLFDVQSTWTGTKLGFFSEELIEELIIILFSSCHSRNLWILTHVNVTQFIGDTSPSKRKLIKYLTVSSLFQQKHRK